MFSRLSLSRDQHEVVDVKHEDGTIRGQEDTAPCFDLPPATFYERSVRVNLPDVATLWVSWERIPGRTRWPVVLRFHPLLVLEPLLRYVPKIHDARARLEEGLQERVLTAGHGLLQCFDRGDVLDGLDDAGAHTLLDEVAVALHPARQLRLDEFTQPALLSASVALWRLWCEHEGPAPEVMLGHSLGEYSALVCADAISFADAVRLVNVRGTLMQAAVPTGEGAMAAVLGLEDEQVAACCAAAAGAGTVSPANFNAPGQIVIAGTAAAVEAAIEQCQAAGARRAVKLAVSVPSHCSLMDSAREQFADHLGGVEIRPPAIPVLHNVDAEAAADVDGIRDRLSAQLSQPVRWTDCVRAAVTRGVTDIVECGPGKVLAGLQKRIDRSVTAHNVATPEDFDAARAQLQ